MVGYKLREEEEKEVNSY